MEVEMNRFRKNFTQTIWNRGKQYYLGNCVHIITCEESFASAYVEGNDDYEVEVYVKGDKVEEYSCSCPASKGGENLCKHIAALCMELDNYQQRFDSLQKLGGNDCIEKIFDHYTDEDNEIYYGKEEELFAVAYERITHPFEDKKEYIHELFEGIIQTYMIDDAIEEGQTFLNYCYQEVRNIYDFDKEFLPILYEKIAYFISQAATIEEIISFLSFIWGVEFPTSLYIEIMTYLSNFQELFMAALLIMKLKHKEPMQNLYEQVSKYQDMQAVKELQLRLLMEIHDYQYANTIFQSLLKMKEYYLLSIKDIQKYAILLKNKAFYRQKVETYLKGWKSTEDYQYVSTFRSMFTDEEWEQEKDEILKSWMRFVEVNRYTDILKSLREYDYLFLLALETENIYVLWDNFGLLQGYDEERFASVILFLLDKKIMKANLRQEYRLYVEMMAHFQRFSFKDKMYEEFLHLLKYKYGDKIFLMEELQCFEVGGVNE